MCVIFSCDKNMPTVDTLETGERINPHGGGIAWTDGEYVHWKKGINAKQIDELIKEREIKPPILVHFRITSVGETLDELCHPFPFSKSGKNALEGKTKNWVLTHNGTWSDWKDLGLSLATKLGRFPKGKLSDTRVMTWIASNCGHEVLELINDQKIAILTPKGIIKYGEWETIENDGNQIEASNKFGFGSYIYHSYDDAWGIPYYGKHTRKYLHDPTSLDSQVDGTRKLSLDDYEDLYEWYKDQCD